MHLCHTALFSLLTALQTSVSQKDGVNPLGKAPRLDRGLQEVSSPASCSKLGHHWIRARLCPDGCWKLPGRETPHSIWLLVPRLLCPSRRNFFMSRQNLIRADLVFVSILMKNVKQIQVRLWFLLIRIKNAFSLIMTSYGQLFLFLSLWMIFWVSNVFLTLSHCPECK